MPIQRTEFRDGQAYEKWFYSQQPGSGRVSLGRKQFTSALDRLGFSELMVSDGIRRRSGTALKPDEEE